MFAQCGRGKQLSWVSLLTFGIVLGYGIGPCRSPAVLTQDPGRGGELEIYVSPQGDDSHPGTREQPLASLEKALEIVRTIRRQKGHDLNINVILAEGTYRLSETLSITPKENPGPGCLRILAATPGKVILSGGRVLTGWQKVENRWQARVPSVEGKPLAFRELFVNGRRAIRARTPNEGFFRIDRPGRDRRTSLFVRASDSWAFAEKMSGVEFVYLHDWSTSRVTIAAFDPNSLEVKFNQKIGCSAPHYEIGHWPHARFFLENGEAMLDQPGEWYLDAEKGLVTYLPMENEKLKTAEFVVPLLESLVKISGDPAVGPVKNVEWHGVVFEHCRFDLPPAGYAAGQATIYEPRREPQSAHREMMPAAVTLDLASDCRFTACSFRHLGGSGVWFRRECSRGAIRQCVFEDISGNAINIGETVSRSIQDASPYWSSPFETGCTWGIHVEDCLIQRCGVQFLEAVGIWVGLAAGNTIEYNEVAYLPYSGMSVGWSWNDQPTGCRENIVRGNHIHHCMLILHDGGGIYTLGRQPGTQLLHNVIHDIPPNEDGAESNGIFMDEGSSEILVEGHTLYNIGRSPIRFHRALEITLRANTVVCKPGVPPYRYNRTNPETLRFENNVVIESEQWTPPKNVRHSVGRRGTPEVHS